MCSRPLPCLALAGPRLGVGGRGPSAGSGQAWAEHHQMAPVVHRGLPRGAGSGGMKAIATPRTLGQLPKALDQIEAEIDGSAPQARALTGEVHRNAGLLPSSDSWPIFACNVFTSTAGAVSAAAAAPTPHPSGSFAPFTASFWKLEVEPPPSGNPECRCDLASGGAQATFPACSGRPPRKAVEGQGAHRYTPAMQGRSGQFRRISRPAL